MDEKGIKILMIAFFPFYINNKNMFIKEKKGIERIFIYYLVNLTWIEKANKISDYLR
jgi:hypothetical protein